LFCFQGTLREAVDAGMLVNKASGMHDVPIVLSLAHNVACAMAYLHQVRYRHRHLGSVQASPAAAAAAAAAGTHDMLVVL
jgi:hypothetical protein